MKNKIVEVVASWNGRERQIMNEEKTWENMEKRRAKEREKYGRMIEKELVHSLLNDEIPLETSQYELGDGAVHRNKQFLILKGVK